uniref:ATPase family AAA domain-containing protein 5-like n=1 Tax=Myxine glutinosa TaxID=7769 RepID=UPI00358F2F26
MVGAVAVETLMENFPAERTHHHDIDKPRNNTITSYFSQLPCKVTPATSPQLHHMDLLKYFSPRSGSSSKSQDCLVAQKDFREKTSKHVNAVLSKSGKEIKHTDEKHKVKTKRKKKELDLEIIELESTDSLEVFEERKVKKTEGINIRKNERCSLEETEERQQPVRMSKGRGCSKQKPHCTSILGHKAQRGNANLQGSHVVEEKGLKQSIDETTKKVSNKKKGRAKKELSVLSVENTKIELVSSDDFDKEKSQHTRERSKVRPNMGSLSDDVQENKTVRTAPSLDELNASVGSNDQSGDSKSTKKEKSEFMAAFRRLSNSSLQEPPLHSLLQRPHKKQCKSTGQGEQEGTSSRKVPQRAGVTMQLLGQQESKGREQEQLIIDEGSNHQGYESNEVEVMDENKNAEIEEVSKIEVYTKKKGGLARKKNCGKYKECLKGKAQRGNANLQGSHVMEERGLKQSIDETTKKVSNKKKGRAKKELSVLSVENTKIELVSSDDFDKEKSQHTRERSKVRPNMGSLSDDVQENKTVRIAPSLDELNASVGSNDQSGDSKSTKKEKSEFMAAFRRLSNSSSQEPPLHSLLQRPHKKQCKSTGQGEQEGTSSRKVPQRAGVTMQLLGQQESKGREQEQLIIDEGSNHQGYESNEVEVMDENKNAEIEEVSKIEVYTKKKGGLARKKNCGKYKECLKGKAQRGNANLQGSHVMEERGLKQSIDETTKKVSNKKKGRAKKELSVLSVENTKIELVSSDDFDKEKSQHTRERSKVRPNMGSLSDDVQENKTVRIAPSLDELNASVGSNDQSGDSKSTKKEKSEFMAAFRRLSNSSSQEPPLHSLLQRPHKKQCKSTGQGEQEGTSSRKVPQRAGVTMQLLGQQESKGREQEQLIIDEGSNHQGYESNEVEVMDENKNAEIEEVSKIEVYTKKKGEGLARKKNCGKYKECLKGKSKDKSQCILTIDNITFCKKTHKEDGKVAEPAKMLTKKDTKAQSKKCIRKSCVVKAQLVKACDSKRTRRAQQNVGSTDRGLELKVKETNAKRQNLRRAIRRKRKQILIRSLYRSEQLEAEETKKGSPIRLKLSRVVPCSTPEDKSDIKRVARKGLPTKLKHKRLYGKRRTSQDRLEQAPLYDSSQDCGVAQRNTQTSTVILSDGSPKRCGQNLMTPRTKMTRSCKSLLNEFCSTRKATAPEAKPVAEAALKLAPIFQPRISTPVLSVKALDSDGIIEVKGICLAQQQPFLQSVPTKRAACALARVAPTANLPAFLPVVHVLQKDDSSCWDLPFPASLQFCRSTSEPVPVIMPSTTLSLGQLTWAKISSCREDHALWAAQCVKTDIQHQALLEEIKAAQPGLSVNTFYQRLLSKRFSDSPAGFRHSNMEGIKGKGHQGSINHLGVQNKRKAEGGSNRNCRRKRRRPEMEEKAETLKDAESDIVIGASSRSNSEAVGISERARMKVRRHSGDALRHGMSKAESFDASGYGIAGEEASKRNFEFVDNQLWTDRYQPKASKDIVGNTGAVSRLHSWLKEWKQHVNKEAKRNRRGDKEAKHTDSTKHGPSDSDFESQSDTESSMTTDSDLDDGLCSAALLCGPPGVGKTAAVYACAHELGYKVFEVNCSSLRSGRILVSQLQEATQSHQVHKAKSHGQPFTVLPKGCGQTTGDGTGTQKHASPKKSSPSPRKNSLPHHPRASLKQTRQRAKPPSKSQIPAAFANFLKSPPPLPQRIKNEQSVGIQSPTSTPVTARLSSTKATQAKYSATTSLILFEEVDVIFDDDIGFLSAIKTFMATTKRPIVLTTNDPKFCNMFEGHYEQIIFERPSMLSATAFLRLVCLAEGLRTRCDHVDSLVAWTRCDLRRSLLSLQLWAAAGGGTKLPTADKLENTLQQEGDVLQAAPSVFVGEESGASCVESTRSVCALCAESSSFGMQLLPVLGVSGFCQQVSSLTELQRLGLDVIQDHWPQLINLSGSRHLHNLSPVLEKIAGDGKTSPRCLKMGIGRLNEPDLQPGLQIEDDGPGDLIDRSSFGILDEGEDKAKLDKDRSFSEKPLEKTILNCLEYLTDLLVMFSTIDSWPPGGGVEELEGPCRHGNGYDWLPAEVKSGQVETVRAEEGENGWAQPWKEWPELRATTELKALQKCRDKTARALKSCKGHGSDIATNTEFKDFEISRFITEASEEQRRLSQRHSLLQDALLHLVSPAALGARRAVVTETTPYLRFLCRMEKKREATGNRRRFRHYLEERLDVPRTLLKFLDADFP